MGQARCSSRIRHHRREKIRRLPGGAAAFFNQTAQRPLCRPPHSKHQDSTMEAERINLIGTQLTDLSARTQELRGYL